MGGVFFDDFEIIVVSFGCPCWVLFFLFTNFVDQLFWFERLSNKGHKLVHNIRYDIPVLVPPFYSYTNLSILINLWDKVSVSSQLLFLWEMIRCFLVYLLNFIFIRARFLLFGVYCCEVGLANLLFFFEERLIWSCKGISLW